MGWGILILESVSLGDTKTRAFARQGTVLFTIEVKRVLSIHMTKQTVAKPTNNAEFFIFILHDPFNNNQLGPFADLFQSLKLQIKNPRSVVLWFNFLLFVTEMPLYSNKQTAVKPRRGFRVY